MWLIFFSITPGEYDYSMGTHVVFEKDEDVPVDPLYTRCDNFYRFDSKTNKTLKMSRVLLKDPSVEEANEIMRKDSTISLDQIENEEDDSLKIKRTYEDALNLFLKNPNKKAPRKITGEDESISLQIVSKCKLTMENK